MAIDISAIPLCVDCKFFDAPTEQCRHANSEKPIDRASVVRGPVIRAGYFLAEVQRSYECGFTGRDFEPLPGRPNPRPPQTKPWWWPW